MLGLAEYSVLSSELWSIALKHEQDLVDYVTPDMPKAEAVRMTEMITNRYYSDYKVLLRGGLSEIAYNAFDYYNNQTNANYSEQNMHDLAEKLVEGTYAEKYYGATLQKRLAVNAARLARNVARSAVWGAGYEGIHNLLTKQVPYGAQYNIDRRVLLAMAAKVEQDVAKQVAEDTDTTLVRWSLSGLHLKADICDDLAANVSRSVVSYIEENNLKINPKGIYFVKDLPPPPHPNCMCEYGLVEAKRETRGPVKRTVSRIRNLIQRFRRK